jgi:ubiquinone/menaquinone biosynthesis C-methylase UbiE
MTTRNQVSLAGGPARFDACPCCGGGKLNEFFTASGVPVNSCLSLRTRQEALDFPLGTVALTHCSECGFIFNAAFDASLLEYSERYDPTQAFSDTFNRWHRNLAERLVREYELHGRKIIEIGCGKGEFLSLLCSLGQNDGVGFDPAYTPSRAPDLAGGSVRFVADFYSEKYADTPGDFMCCKMTLEHISPAHEFISTVRRAVANAGDPIVLFQVPDTLRVLEEKAFWDIYYEHCSYFSAGSLARLFRRAGFGVVDLAREYDNQYLMIEARANPAEDRDPAAAQDLEQVQQLVDRFAQELPVQLDGWRARLRGWRERGQRAVIWGAGSKGVAFLTTLGISDEIEYAVDINPHRRGLYMAKTGQQICSPQMLTEYKPDVVIVMNPIYRDEIVAQLDQLGLQPEVLTT